MIGIKRNIFPINTNDGNRYNLAAAIGHIELHTHFRFHVRRKITTGKLHYAFILFLSVCFISRNMYCFFLTYCHARNTFIKAFDHITIANLEFKRVAPG